MTEEPKDEGAAITRMAGLMGEAIEAAAAGQALSLSILQAEVAAMAGMLQGHTPTPETEAEQEERRRNEEARIETDFDNMPV